MTFEYIDSQNKKNRVLLDNNYQATDKWESILTTTKLEFIQKFIPAFKSQQKIVLFDANHKQLLQFYTQNDINNLQGVEKLSNQIKLLFFTSGSSGFPVGAFKSIQNLESEVAALKKIVSKRAIKKVVVTVPFIHIYGVLAGLLLPLSLGDVNLVVKEDFLPYELLEEVKDEDTLVVTTPVFIKALAKVSTELSLKNALFISSTGPLSPEDIESFTTKYETDIMQIFGSTETGGIAYKFNQDERWKPLESVHIKSKDEKLNISSDFVSPFLLKEKIETLHQPYQTEDVVEIEEDGFKLLGRSNKLIKIAGKRISALQIEKILEEIPEINRCIVELIYKKELLRSEQILITIEATNRVQKRVLKEKISQYYGIITIPFNLKYVDKINYSSMGKKVIF